MTYAWREVYPGSPPIPFAAIWIIEAPWAHPVWTQYGFYLTDLTTVMDEPPTINLEGATHECLLYALDPLHRHPPDCPIKGRRLYLLGPPNYGYQFIAESDTAALGRLQGVVDLIVAQGLSPDTDWRRRRDKTIFRDAHPMVRSRTLVEIEAALSTKH